MKRKPISPKVRFEIFKRDKFTCQYCGAKAPHVRLEVDHREPVCEGGSNEMDNLATACWPCNAGKSGNRMPRTISEIDLREAGLDVVMKALQQHFECGFPWWWVVESIFDQVTDDFEPSRAFRSWMRAVAEAEANGWPQGPEGSEGHAIQ